MSEPGWRLGAFATTAGLAVFAWGLAFGSSHDTLAARVLAWPRSDQHAGASYAVQLVALEGNVEAVQARVQVLCEGAPRATDESGYLLFSGTGALTARTCTTARGTIALQAPEPPVGSASMAEPIRARVTGVGLRDQLPELFLEDAELAIDAPALAWLRIAPARAHDLKVDPEPGLEGRVVARCEDGFALELRARYHVTGLHLEWGPLTQRERLDVMIPVSRGGPVVEISQASDSMRLAHIRAAGGEPVVGGWLALFGPHGLISSATSAAQPWEMPRVTEPAVLVATRGSFFDSASTRARVPRAAEPCARARALERPWPAPQPAVLVADGVERVRVAQRQRVARARRTASFGLAGGLLGLAAALLGRRNARVTARALAAFAITLTLFGVLAMLLYAS